MTEPYTPTTEEVRHKWAFEEGDVYESAAEFDRWFSSEIAKAEARGYFNSVQDAYKAQFKFKEDE